MGELDSYIFYYDNQTHCAHARRKAIVRRSRFGSAVASYSRVLSYAWRKGSPESYLGGIQDSGIGVAFAKKCTIYDVRHTMFAVARF